MSRPRHAADRGPDRRTWLLLGVAIALSAVTLSVVGVSWWAGRAGSDPPGPTPSASTSPTPSPTPELQQTLLLQVRDDAGLAVDNVLLGAGGGPARAVFLYALPGLLVDVPGSGPMMLAETVQESDTLASVQAVSDLLGVRVDGGLVLDRLAFAGLVDAVGGVPVEVRRTIRVVGDDGQVLVTIPKGARTLNGRAASYYVTVQLPGEKDGARLQRFSDVLVKVVADLPDDLDRMRQVLTSLGALARSTIPTEDVAAFLLQLQAELLADQRVYATLPATPVAGTDPRAYLLNHDAAELMLTDLLPEAVLGPGEGERARVLVQDGTGDVARVSRARDRLVGAGFAFVNGGATTSPDPTRTRVLLPDDSAAARERGLAVAEALGVPSTALAVATSGQNVADVVVLLGTDAAPEEP